MRAIYAGAIALGFLTSSGHAAKRLSFMTTWRAQAEHGGYYQGVAKGFYQACGVELLIRQGGPGVDGKQLLVAGAIDMMSAAFNEIALLVNIAGFPAKAVMAI